MTHVLVLVGMLAGGLQAAVVPARDAKVCSQPVAAQQVARRAVALGFLASRAWLEMKVLEATRVEDLKLLHRRQDELLARAKVLKVDSVFNARERALFHKDLGGWKREEVALGSWAMEGAGTLLWAMGVQDALPDYHEPLNMEAALRPIMSEGGAEDLIDDARLRGVDELQRMHSESALFMWRSRHELQRRRKGGAAMDAESTRAVQQEIAKANRVRPFKLHNGQDLLAGRTPVGSLDPRSLNLLAATSQARSDAMRFACGQR